jgi:hypothetical protein
MKFGYTKYGPIVRPVISVKLKWGDKELGYTVLVDSGADMCLFDAEIGKLIGIDIERGKKREVFGVGGKASFYFLCPVQIEVGGWTYEIEAGFMPEVSGRVMPYGLVGQRGFFDNFIVKFDLLKEEIELKRRE